MRLGGSAPPRHAATRSHQEGAADGLFAERIVFGHDRGISLQVEHLCLKPGQLTGLLGPNGAGKSTILRLLAGIWRPHGGVIYICGQDVDNLSAARRARLIGWVPQRVETPFDWTVWQMVSLGRSPHTNRLLDRSEDRRVTSAAIARLGLSRLEERLIATLSGGEWQRALIARALAQEPRVLLLDEPVANLDLGYQRSIYEMVLALARDGVAVLVADHHIDLLAHYCDRLLLMVDGRIAADGTPAEVLRQDALEGAFATPLAVSTDPATGRPVVRWDFNTRTDSP